MGNKKNMKTLNTLSLIVTLTIFLANGSMSKNLNRNTTNSRPHLPAPGSNGSGINPNWKTQNDIKPPMESLPTPQNMPGFNGAGINPNSKPSLKIEAMDAPIHAIAGKNGAGINPNSKPSLKIEKYKTIHDIAGENGAGINPNSKPTLEIQPMGPAPRKHAMPGANGTGINPNMKISTHIKPEHARPPMPMPGAYRGGRPPMPTPGANGSGIYTGPSLKPSSPFKPEMPVPIELENWWKTHKNSHKRPMPMPMPGANGSGINPNLKISTDIKPEHAMPGANGTGINPNMKISTHIKP